MALDTSTITGNVTGVSQGSDDEVWKKNPRASCGVLGPLPLQGKLALKTFEVELHRQVNHSHQQLQQDLDLLHEQVHAEVHAAITKELQSVVRRIAEVLQSVESVRHEVGPIHEKVEQLSEEVLWVRQRREMDASEASAAAQTVVDKAASATNARLAQMMQTEVTTLRGEMQEVRQQLEHAFAIRLQRAQDVHSETRQEAEHTLKDLRDRVSGQLDELKEDITQKLQEEGTERKQLAAKLNGEQDRSQRSLSEMRETLLGEAAVGEARFRDAQAALADLEQRLTDALHRGLDTVAKHSDGAQHKFAEDFALDLKERVTSLASDVKTQIVSMDTQLQRFASECNEGLKFAQASWVRLVEWQAEVNVEQLERDGKCMVISPLFTAAGLKSLQLHLRIHASGGRGEESKPQRWSCGAFLHAPQSQISFRLHINGRSQAFAAEFGETAEWGSQRIAVLDRIEAVLCVKLEIMDVVAPVLPGKDWPTALAATLQHADAVQAAGREVAMLRSTLVRKVEWRLARVSERLAASRAAGEDEACEPLCSPPFSAAGVEGMQLQLYPLGYRTRSDDMCGFFLVCPKGVYVRCRAFLGDASRTFEHQYEVREPYGRGSFCRLADKLSEDDSVICGVEFLEVRQEQMVQVRGGPFGNVLDQMKIVSDPANGGMEMVRQLNEVQHSAGGAAAAGRQRLLRQRSVDRAMPHIAKPPAQPPLASKSMPVLLPAVGGGGLSLGAGVQGAASLPRRQADLTPMH